ncbi:MAG: hypothetical protein Sylvanvirus32_8, partial [Sylvanvirus sp.]
MNLIRRILIHCDRGESRSPSVMLYILMITRHWSLPQAYQWLQNIDPIIDP